MPNFRFEPKADALVSLDPGVMLIDCLVMKIIQHDDATALGRAAATDAKGTVRVILGTGTSQYAVLDAMRQSVPQRAISMSIRQIIASRKIILSMPDARNPEAVRNAVEGTVTPDCLASSLRKHLDAASASLLSQ